MSLKLNTASGGSITLQEADTASNLTITVPATTGTLALTSNIPASYTNSDALTLFNASGSAPVYACRAWVNFNGTGTVAIRASGNVSSITDGGAGLYTVNFTTAMPDANYCPVIGTSLSTANNGMIANIFNDNSTPIAPTTSGFTLMIGRRSDGTPLDSAYVTAAVFR
jgi:hypothetical protein